jgi:hypothetical protein
VADVQNVETAIRPHYYPARTTVELAEGPKISWAKNLLVQVIHLAPSSRATTRLKKQ